jgi:hypothetical protein
MAQIATTIEQSKLIELGNSKSFLWQIKVMFFKIKDKWFWKKYKLKHKLIVSPIGEHSEVVCKFPNKEPFIVKIKRIWVEFGHNGDYDKFYIMADTTIGMSTINALFERAEWIKVL